MASSFDSHTGGKKLPMQEDIENKSLTLIINTSKLTARTLATAFMKFLRYSRNKIQAHQNVKPQGKQSVRQLIAQNQGVEYTELADRNVAKSFDRYARQYGVDYAIQKGYSQEGKPRYILVLQGARPERHQSGDGSLLGCMGQAAEAGALCRRADA